MIFPYLDGPFQFHKERKNIPSMHLGALRLVISFKFKVPPIASASVHRFSEDFS
jgi:hypothetical protein